MFFGQVCFFMLSGQVCVAFVRHLLLLVVLFRMTGHTINCRFKLPAPARLFVECYSALFVCCSLDGGGFLAALT